MKEKEELIADLEAAHDFVFSELKMLEDKAKQEGINPEKL